MDYFNTLSQVRKLSPLVHNITNYVVMNSTANNLLALGASPIMAHAEEEMAEMVAIAHALVVNIGTLSAPWVRAMKKAVAEANRLDKPSVLDPVGLMCSKLRRETVRDLVRDFKWTAIRGNASEILGLHSLIVPSTEKNKTNVSLGPNAKGVDSLYQAKDAIAAAQELALATGSIIGISGEVDYIVNKERIVTIANGHPLMPKVTGMGCTSSAVIAAFLALKEDAFNEVLGGQLAVSLAGERCFRPELHNRPASYEQSFRDQLMSLSEKDYEYAKVKSL